MVCCHHAGLDQDDDVEIPWWTYGARGMQLWFPKALSEPLSASSPIHYATDPELEFDREVYPIGVSLSEVSIVGVLRPVAFQAYREMLSLPERPLPAGPCNPAPVPT